MKNHTPILLSLFIAGLSISFASPAIAARSYLVELVVFKNNDSNSEEKWTSTTPPLNARKMSRAIRPANVMAQISKVPTEIKDSDFSFYVNRIRKKSHKTVLLSTRWVQTVLDPTSTKIIRITNRVASSNDLITKKKGISPGSFDRKSKPVLDGFIHFYLTGAYTIEADLRYTQAYRPSILDEDPSAGPVTYRIHEKRKMKSGEMNYYDHPKIGMVLRVTPIKKPTGDTG